VEVQRQLTWLNEQLLLLIDEQRRSRSPSSPSSPSHRRLDEMARVRDTAAHKAALLARLKRTEGDNHHSSRDFR
jgi:hypothetical protein